MPRKATGSFRPARVLAFLLCLSLCLLSLPASLAESPAESALTLSLPKEVKGYAHCEITVTAPAAGDLLLTLYDSLDNPWLYRREQLTDGENLLSWDGRGAGGELLMSGPYRFEAVFSAADGREFTASASFDVRGYAPALALALPSSETLYLDGGESWFVECWVPNACIVAMDVLDASGNPVYTKSVSMGDRDRDVIRWDGTGSNHRKLTPGEYTVHLYPKKNPDFDYTWPLTVAEAAPEKPAVAVTGPVIPERGMSDAEIWEIMMKPSVVVNATGSSSRFVLRESPTNRSAAVGLVCCATQGLEVLAIEGDWAQVRAGNYSDGHFITGWYPVKGLTVVTPAPHYAVLVDKRTQTLTVYHDGVPLGTVPVSTGLPTEKKPQRETSPGAFLTDIHFSRDFAQDGARYDYPLRYQGGNIIHSTGYARIPHAAYSVKDYSKNLPRLGQKASHGCVRVSPFTTPDCEINSYWLWTHLPFHTRVIILDD
ncbi:MAG: L,D-transpeptidase family protein [Clostridia bacterium]|nr:L,D-transpeptidase family protein [Clostridia bacterium]